MSNYSKPIQIILIGSSTLSVLIFILFSLFNQLLDWSISYLLIALFSITSALIIGLVFSILIEKFITKKIRDIYNTINFDKRIKSNNLNNDVLDTLTKDTEDWAEQRLKEIEKLESQAKFRREFLGNLAHELKTPVFSIQGYVLTLLEGGLEDESVNRLFLNKALTGVERITNVLDDLDEISRFEFDRFNLKLARFNIVQLTQEVFDTLDSKAHKKEINLQFEKVYDPIFVSADKGKIGQVLINLISNSIAYGNTSGNTTIKFNKLDKKHIQITVQDNGIGIEEAHLDRLFERFYRVEKSRARNIAGSGLGLAIVKHIIEAHNQSIAVDSKIDKGTSFTFTLNLD